MLRELEKGRLWNSCALRPLRWFQGWLGITNYPEEHFEDELQHPVNNPASSVWQGQRQETVKSLCLLSFLCVKIKDVLLKAFCLHLKDSSSFSALQKYISHGGFSCIPFSFSKHSYVPFSTNNPVLLDISVCFLPSANLNLASVA